MNELPPLFPSPQFILNILSILLILSKESQASKVNQNPNLDAVSGLRLCVICGIIAYYSDWFSQVSR